MATKKKMEEACILFRNRRFEEAEKSYKQCLQVYPEDCLAHYFIKRCGEYVSVPPDSDWDGSLSLTTK